MSTEQFEVGSEKIGKIRISRVHNHLASQRAGRATQVGRIQYLGAIDLAGIAKEIIDSGYAIKKEHVTFVLSAANQIVYRRLAEGYIIHLGVVSMRATATGTYDEEKPNFSTPANKIVIRSHVPAKRRDITNSCTIEFVDTVKTPVIESLCNLINMEEWLYGQGTNAEITGKNLSFNPSATDEGIFLTSDSGEEVAVTILRIRDKDIRFTVQGEIEGSCEGTLTLATRGGDSARANPITVSIPVILKPAE